MSPEFEVAYLRFAAIAFEKQLALQDLVGERAWSFDMDTGQLVFGKKKLFDKPLVFDAQILGSASEGAGSWLWSWANETVTQNLSRASLILREKGEARDFQTPSFPIDLDQSDDHRVVMTSVGVLAKLSGCDAYYRGPYAGGAAYFVLRDPRLHLAPADALRVATVFPMFLQSVTVADHRAAFVGYLEERGIGAQVEAEDVRAQIGASSLLARFDELNRLVDLQVVARN